MAKHYVFSTMANGQRYQSYLYPDGGKVVPTTYVDIAGGAGLATDKLVTPLGVMTEVNDEQLAELEANHHFQNHMKGGFITVRRSKADPDKVAESMNDKDPSKPKTPSDYKGASGTVIGL